MPAVCPFSGAKVPYIVRALRRTYGTAYLRQLTITPRTPVQLPDGCTRVTLAEYARLYWYFDVAEQFTTTAPSIHYGWNGRNGRNRRKGKRHR